MFNKANLRDFIAATGLMTSNEIQMDFSAHVTLKFDRWLQEMIGNIFHAPKNYAYHFIAIHEFKLSCHKETLKSAPVILKLNRWPWKIIMYLVYSRYPSSRCIGSVCASRCLLVLVRWIKVKFAAVPVECTSQACAVPAGLIMLRQLLIWALLTSAGMVGGWYLP